MNGDDELARKMGQSASDLYDMKYNDLLIRVKTIIKKAMAHKDPLIAEYGLTEEQIIDLQSDCDRLADLNGKSREYQIKSGMATKNLETTFSETSSLLDDKLDKLMKLFKTSDPNFYQGYLKARMVIDY
jgi:hypothetical protein